MSVRIGIKGLILVSTLLFGILGTSILSIGAPATADGYPPLPMLTVKTTTGGGLSFFDVWLTGEREEDLDPYWDIIGFDIIMHYNVDALEPYAVTVDPDGWWDSFWPEHVLVVYADIYWGYIRVLFTGLSGPGGEHTPPFGKGRLFNVEAAVVDETQPTGISLMGPEPRPEMLPLWGPEYFRVDVIGTPHPDRMEPPWNGYLWAVPIPHLTSPPIARISASTTTPTSTGIPVTFDGSGSYHPGLTLTYAWDFESDGVIDAYGVTATYAYPLRGFHIVTLTVTDIYGGTDSATLLMSVKPLQRAWPEHHVYSVSGDEDAFNTLFARFKNEGAASGDVKAEFTVFDRATGMQVGPTLEATGTVAAHSTLDLSVDFLPPETGAKYEVSVSAFYLDEAGNWIKTGRFPMVFKVVP